MVTTAPPLDEHARHLLSVIDRMPVRTPDRDRVITALELIATSEWVRVRVTLTDEEVQGLSVPGGFFTPNELAHVLEVATTVARMYSFETVGVGHVAVALAATSRRAGLTAIDVMAEVFGLGTLENSAQIVNHHLTLQEAPDGGQREAPPGEEEVKHGETPRAQALHQAACVTHLALRVAAAAVLFAIAAGGGSGWAWPVAFAALVSTRDAREPRPLVVDEVSPVQPPAALPWLGCLTVAAGAFGLWASAAVTTALALLLDAVSCAGLLLTARFLWIEGTPEAGVSRHVSRLLSQLEVYTVRRRCIRLGIVVLLAAVPSGVVAAVEGGRAWPLYVVTAVFAARRRTVWALLATAVALTVTVGPAWLLLPAWAGGLAARAGSAWADRPPNAAVPVAGPGPGAALTRQGRRHLKARRLLRLGRPAAALAYLDAADSDLTLTALRGWALLQSGRPGEAKRAVYALPDTPLHTRALVTCLAELDLSNGEAALRALSPISEIIDDDTPTVLYGEALVARVRLTLYTEGGTPRLTDGIARCVPRRIHRANLLHAVTLMRLAAESALPTSRELSFLLAGLGAMISGPEPYLKGAGFFGLIGRVRPLALENLRCIICGDLTKLWEGRPDTDTVTRMQADEGAPGYLMRMDRPVEAANTLITLADRLADTAQYRPTAIRSRIEALAMLNATRHQLTDSEDRHHLWRLFGRTIEQAMREATAQRDWQSLAELIESARLQLGPDGEGNAFDASQAVAPFIRVRGVSRLEESHWYRPDEQPPTYALEDLASIVLGEGTWWWSTWSTRTELFWSLVPPTGTVSGGVLPFGPGSALRTALADLRNALPVRHPGEDDEQFEERVLDSPLLAGPPTSEADLTGRLAKLLPDPLASALLAAAEPLPLAIAPAAELALVPWACLRVPARSAGDLRLIDRCLPAIVPPAGLLAAVAARPRTVRSPAPLGLAVIDPGCDLPHTVTDDAAANAGPLDTARALLDQLPRGVEIIGPDDDVNVEDFAARLRALDPETSAVFACHTDMADTSAASRGLRLRPKVRHPDATEEQPLELLTATALIGEPTRFPMPHQVLLLACDTADLSNAADGEWLVLGPAMLWAGAERLIVTSYPIIDQVEEQGGEDVLDRRLVRLLVDGQPLANGLRTVQLEELARWRATRHLPWDGEETPRSSPVHWAGHIAMGAFADVPTPRPLKALHEPDLGASLVALLADADSRASLAGRTVTTVGDVLVELGLYGFQDELPPWRRNAVLATAYSYVLLSAAVPARVRPGGGRSPGATGPAKAGLKVRELLRAAEDIARIARHRVIAVEHLLAAVLGSSGSAGRLARALCGWDGRHPEVVKEVIGDAP